MFKKKLFAYENINAIGEEGMVDDETSHSCKEATPQKDN